MEIYNQVNSKKLNFWRKMAVDQSAWIKACLQILFFIKIQAFKLQLYKNKKSLRHRYFSMNFTKIL